MAALNIGCTFYPFIHRFVLVLDAYAIGGESQLALSMHVLTPAVLLDPQIIPSI